MSGPYQPKGSLTSLLRRLWFDWRIYMNNRVITGIPSHGIRRWWYRRVMRLKVGKGTSVFMGLWLDCLGGVEIGENTAINHNARIDGRGGVKIGSCCSIGSDVCILTASHDLNSEIFDGVEKPVVIGDYAFIGTRAIIMPGVTIGKGGAVGAGSIVTKDVGESEIVAGVPAKPIGKRTCSYQYNPEYWRFFH